MTEEYIPKTKEELEQTINEIREYLKKPHKPYTAEELEEDDADGGYFWEYDEDGNRIDDW